MAWSSFSIIYINTQLLTAINLVIIISYLTLTYTAVIADLIRNDNKKTDWRCLKNSSWVTNDQQDYSIKFNILFALEHLQSNSKITVEAALDVYS